MTIGFRCVALLALLLLFIAPQTNAQSLYGEPNDTYQQSNVLSSEFTNWEVFRLDAAALNAAVKQHATPEVVMGTHHWQLNLVSSQIVAADYTLQVLSSKGREQQQMSYNIAFQGYETHEGGEVRLTLTDNFIYGFVKEQNELYYIEPLWYFEPSADADLFVVYADKAVIPHTGALCAVKEMKEKMQDFHLEEPPADAAETISACYQLDLAVASDKSMYTKYMSSVTNVQNHNIGVLNNVQGNYTGVFNNDIQFNIITQLVITGSDPWSNTTVSGDLLDEFVDWGNGGGFGTLSYDLGELWTNRNFQNGVVGIAYLDAVCTGVRYHCLQDFTSNAQQLRCMSAHEIGHNFSCDHDPQNGSSCPPNFIMCPFVSTTSTWSTTSKNSVNSYSNFLINSGCLSPCSGGTALVADFDWSPKPPCQNQSIHFTDMSTGTVTGRSWTFQGGTPATSTLQNPNIVWANAGSFNVTLTVSGPGGPSTKTQQIVIAPKPTADFTYTVNGNSVSFTNTSVNADTYSWNFGNGFTSTEVNPQFTYPTSGTYNVTLTATNSCGTSTKTIGVKTAPTAAFNASAVSGCTPLSVQFINQSTGSVITSYNWQFPGGTPSSSTSSSPVVVYNTAGSFDVSLTVTNSSGTSTVLKENFIHVGSAPTAGFTWITNDLTVAFTNTSSNGTTYNWNFGDGELSSETNPTHTYATGGPYSITLTVTNSCGIQNFTRNIVLEQGPTPGFSASTTTGCGPLSVSFTNQSSENADTYAWTFQGGVPATSTATNPVVVFNTPGVYTVTLTASNAAGSNTLTRQSYITVNSGPTPSFTSNNTGLTTSFTNTSVNATTYSWNFGDGSNASTAVNPMHTYSVDGVYTVILTATNPCGSSTSTQTVTITTPPTAAFNTAQSSGCAVLSVQFNNQSSSNATSFQWTFPGGSPSSSTATNPVVVYNQPGTYGATLIASNAAGMDTEVQNNTVTVNGPPTAQFTRVTTGATTSFTNGSTNAASYSWNFGDGSSNSTVQNPSHTYSADGVYTVILTATNACGSSTSTQTVTITTPPTAAFNTAQSSGCAALSVQFNNQSSSNATSFQWTFPGGSPSSSTATNPVMVYNQPGTYGATLIASNAAGMDTEVQNNTVTVNGPPTAQFTRVTTGATTSFTNGSTNAASYSWNFGDGTNNSTVQNPSHTYSADGIYTVTLTATNPCGSSTSTQTVTIATPPTAAFSVNSPTGCTPHTVLFSNQSSSNATSFQWTFPGGQPATSTAANPTVVYALAGSYSATLIATNAAGADTVFHQSMILITDGPTAAFTSTSTGLTASFTNGSGNADTYLWNFGDGSPTSTAENPGHTYTMDGSYTVTLTATNECGTHTITRAVSITSAPTANFSVSQTNGCGPLTVQFTNQSSSNATTFAWQFPGGNPSISTMANPLVMYSMPGTYPVTMIATNAAGSDTIQQAGYITILPLPTVAFTAAINGNNVSFSNTSLNSQSFFWNFGDMANPGTNTSTLTNPSHSYTNDGTYTVTLTVTNNCGAASFSKIITIATPPTAAYTASLDQICVPATIQFQQAASANASTYAWTFAGGQPATSSAPNPVVVWNQPGVHVVTFTATNATGSSSSTGTITVAGPPTAGFSSQTAGISVVLSNTSTDATSYLWNFGDPLSEAENTSTATAPSHQFSGVGSYIVTLIATNACGSDTISTPVDIVGDVPLSAFSVLDSMGNTPVFCAPDTVRFTDVSEGAPISWAWEFPGAEPASSTEQNPVVTYTISGDYSVSLTTENIYGTHTVTVDNVIHVGTAPTAFFDLMTTDGTVILNNQSIDANTYLWQFGDGDTSTLVSPEHTYALSGDYDILLLTANDCGVDTFQQSISLVITGAHDPSAWNVFRLFPNPNVGRFTLEMSGAPQDHVEFALFNTLGQQLMLETADFRSGTLQYVFDYQHLPAAMYSLRVRAGNQSRYVKIAVQH